MMNIAKILTVAALVPLSAPCFAQDAGVKPQNLDLQLSWQPDARELTASARGVRLDSFVAVLVAPKNSTHVVLGMRILEGGIVAAAGASPAGGIYQVDLFVPDYITSSMTLYLQAIELKPGGRIAASNIEAFVAESGEDLKRPQDPATERYPEPAKSELHPPPANESGR